MKDPTVRFRIDFAEHNNLGPGKIALLEAVHRSGSISEAARDMNMSYRRAWLLISSLNGGFDEPVTMTVTGGKGGGGARVTEFGTRLIAAYRALEEEITQLTAKRLAEITPHAAGGLISQLRPPKRPLARKAVPLPRGSKRPPIE